VLIFHCKPFKVQIGQVGCYQWVYSGYNVHFLVWHTAPKVTMNPFSFGNVERN
jgi:hypothetical protein